MEELDISDMIIKFNKSVGIIRPNYIMKPQGAKDDWDFRISDLVKNPNATDI